MDDIFATARFEAQFESEWVLPRVPLGRIVGLSVGAHRLSGPVACAAAQYR